VLYIDTIKKRPRNEQISPYNGIAIFICLHDSVAAIHQAKITF